MSAARIGLLSSLALFLATGSALAAEQDAPEDESAEQFEVIDFRARFRFIPILQWKLRNTSFIAMGEAGLGLSLDWPVAPLVTADAIGAAANSRFEEETTPGSSAAVQHNIVYGAVLFGAGVRVELGSSTFGVTAVVARSTLRERVDYVASGVPDADDRYGGRFRLAGAGFQLVTPGLLVAGSVSPSTIEPNRLVFAAGHRLAGDDSGVLNERRIHAKGSATFVNRSWLGFGEHGDAAAMTLADVHAYLPYVYLGAEHMALSNAPRAIPDARQDLSVTLFRIGPALDHCLFGAADDFGNVSAAMLTDTLCSLGPVVGSGAIGFFSTGQFPFVDLEAMYGIWEATLAFGETAMVELHMGLHAF